MSTKATPNHGKPDADHPRGKPKASARSGGAAGPAQTPSTTTGVTTSHGTFTALVEGPADGPLVLFLHGFPQSRHSWRKQVTAAARAGFRAVAFDQRGYSPGVRPDPTDLRAYALDRLVADVLEVADAAGAPAPTRFHLAGHDWGGQVAWATAAAHPDRVRSLFMLSRPHPSAFRPAIEDDADGQRHRSRHHRAFDDPNTTAKWLANDADRLRQVLADQGVPRTSEHHYVEVLGTPEAFEAALAWYRAAASGLGVAVGPIAVPTTYLWGEADATVGPAAAQRTADYVTAPYRFVAIPKAGHFLTDDSGPVVTARLLEHLASASG